MSENMNWKRLISCLVVSLARTSRLQANPQVFNVGTEVGFGLSSLALLASYDRASSSWRMSQTSLWGAWEDLALLETLPKWGMIVSGFLYGLPMLALRTNANAGFAWPTPRSRDYQAEGFEAGKRRWRKRRTMGLQTAVNWPTPRVQNRNSRKALTQEHYSSVALEQAVELTDGQLPRELKSESELNPAAHRYWATPTTRDYRSPDKPGSANMQRKLAKGWTIDLGSQVSDLLPGKLNPDWVESLMGLPPGWTDIAGPQAPAKPSANGKRRE